MKVIHNSSWTSHSRAAHRTPVLKMYSSPNIRIGPHRLLLYRRVGVANRIILRPVLTPFHLVIRHKEALDFGPWVQGTSSLDVGPRWGWHCPGTGSVEVKATCTDGSDGSSGPERVRRKAGDGRAAGDEIWDVKNPTCKSRSSFPAAAWSPASPSLLCARIALQQTNITYTHSPSSDGSLNLSQ